MIYRRLGKSGLQVSALSFGSWITFGKQIDAKVSTQLMHMAYDMRAVPQKRLWVKLFLKADGHDHLFV
jgi:hypothetical protein